MNKSELEVQKKLVCTFEELGKKVKELSSEVTGLGWKQRNALIAHVYSNYTKHDELNSARKAWENKHLEMNVHKWLYDLMVQHRDIWGYFENQQSMMEEIKSIYKAAIIKEMFEIASILNFWLEKLTANIDE